MDKSDVIILIGSTYTTDEIGQRTESETYKQVFCRVRSVSGTEWFAGGQNGINAQKQITMFKYDYSGELKVNIGGTISTSSITGGENFAVYRTYESNDDDIELYLERKAGV